MAAAKALEQACAERGLETQHVDLLDYTTPAFRRIYRQLYFDLVRSAPNLVDWLGKRLDRPLQQGASRQLRIMMRLTHGLTRLVSYRLPRHIRNYGPDVVVHTHFLPPQILNRLSQRLLVPQVVVVTDFACHRLWIQANVARYFVATDEVAVHLASSGTAPQRIEVTGIPIDLRYSVLLNKDEAKAGLGLPLEREVLLLMASGLRAATLRTLITGIKALRRPLTTAVICGRSHDSVGLVKGELEGYDGLVRFSVFGFSDDIPRFMAAADLILGKPGGLTTSEALAAGLPFAVVTPYPLQEEANANYLLECGAGMRIEPLSVLELKLKGYFDNPARRVVMSRAAKAGGKPEAAREVITSLLEKPL